MNNLSGHPKKSRPVTRWFVAAGLAVGLMAPLTASADHEGSGAVEILVSAAVAYAVIDAVGGFDDGDRKKHRHRKHYDRKDRYHRHGHRKSDRRYLTRHEYRHHVRDAGHHHRDFRRGVRWADHHRGPGHDYRRDRHRGHRY